MAGDHKCPVCSSTFTRPQHVARHMRSHTGDRPYKCTHCGDQFARSDLLSRHVNKCHAAEKPPTTTQPARRKGHAQPGSSSTGVRGPGPSLIPPPHTRKICDACSQSRTPAQCDAGLPCGKCMQRNTKCTYIKATEANRRHTITGAPSIPLFAPPAVVPSMAGPGFFPPQSNFNFSIPVFPHSLDAHHHQPQQHQHIQHQQHQFVDSGNQGITLPSLNSDHAFPHAYYPVPGSDTRPKTGLDAFLDGTYSAGCLYNPTADLMGGQHYIDGYPGYIPQVSSTQHHHTPPEQSSPQAHTQSISVSQQQNYAPQQSQSQSQSQTRPHPQSQSRQSSTDPGVSSAFGLMSLDDPVVAAEMSKNNSFFAPGAIPRISNPTSTSASSHPSLTSTSAERGADLASFLNPPSTGTGSGLIPFLGPGPGPGGTGSVLSPTLSSRRGEFSLGALSPGLGMGLNNMFGSGSGVGVGVTASLGMGGQHTGLTPCVDSGPGNLGLVGGGAGGGVGVAVGGGLGGAGVTPGREANTAELKEFWKAFMRTPGERTPGTGGLGGAVGGGLGQKGLTRMASLPDIRTPGGTISMNPNNHAARNAEPGLGTREDLRSYEMAVLARKTPKLTLVPRKRPGTTGNTNPTVEPSRPQPRSQAQSQSQSQQSQVNHLTPPQSNASSNASSPSSSSAVSGYQNSTSSQSQTESQKRSDRPSFKRLASQTLGPSETKSAKMSHEGEDDGDEWDVANVGISSTTKVMSMRRSPVPSPSLHNQTQTQQLSQSQGLSQSQSQHRQNIRMRRPSGELPLHTLYLAQQNGHSAGRRLSAPSATMPRVI